MTEILGYTVNAGAPNYKEAMLISFPIFADDGTGIDSIYDPHTQTIFKSAVLYEDNNGTVAYARIDDGVGTSVFVVGY